MLAIGPDPGHSRPRGRGEEAPAIRRRATSREAGSEIADAPTERGRRTRERILRAASDLFAEHGYAGVTMRMLGEAAGLDNSSLYRHFPDKRSLATAALDRVTGELLERAGPLRAEAGEADLLESLVGTLVDLGDRLAEDPALSRLLLEWILTRDREESLPTLRSDERERPAVALLTLLAEALSRARRAGAIRRVDVLEALANLVALALVRPATAGTWLAGLGPERSPAARRRARRRELEAFLRGALTPPPRSAPFRPSTSR